MAFERGANFIEFDVRLSADNALIILHDHSVNRTSNGKGPASKLILEELKRMDFGSWFSPKFKGEKIATLNELFQRFGTNIYYDIELKPDRNIERKRILAEKTLDTIHQFGLTDQVLITSFDRKTLKYIRSINKTIFLGLLLDNRINMLSYKSFIKKYNIDAVVLNHKLIQKRTANSIHSRKKILAAYTVNNPKDSSRCIELNVSCIISDDPTKLNS